MMGSSVRWQATSWSCVIYCDLTLCWDYKLILCALKKLTKNFDYSSKNILTKITKPRYQLHTRTQKLQNTIIYSF